MKTLFLSTVLFKSSVEVKKGGFLIVYKEP